MIKYNKLFAYLALQGKPKTILTKAQVVSSVTLAKLGRNESVSISVIDRICDFLDIQPCDVLEFVRNEEPIPQRKNKPKAVEG